MKQRKIGREKEIMKYGHIELDRKRERKNERRE